MKKVLFSAMLIAAFSSCKKDSANTLSPAANASVQANWSSSAAYGQWTSGAYTVYNDVWGSGAGAQNIWANSGSNWGVWSNQPNTSGVKSYPDAAIDINKTLSSLTTVTSSFNATTPSGGSWESTYDIWDQSKANETMLWFNYTGSVGPISYTYGSNGAATPVYTNVTVGGHTWNVYRGNNGNNNVYTFVRTSNTNSATVDILAIQRWIESKGWFGNITQGDVDYGFEITSSSGGLNFTTNSYSVTYN